MAREKRLTKRQDAFAKAMAKVHGNQSSAAREAGYAAVTVRQAGSKNMTKSHVVSAIDRYRARLAARQELTAAQVLGDIAEVAAMAADAGNHGAALKGQELLGKSLGIFVERSERLSVSVDASAAHLAALVDAARRRDPRLNLTVSRVDDD